MAVVMKGLAGRTQLEEQKFVQYLSTDSMLWYVSVKSV
jgi:hypothetical protein